MFKSTGCSGTSSWGIAKWRSGPGDPSVDGLEQQMGGEVICFYFYTLLVWQPEDGSRICVSAIKSTLAFCLKWAPSVIIHV